MLLSLCIKNIALIDSLEIDFSSGLTILSGETGAGKSIIIDSINFVLGERADKSLIRFGENQAQVEAEFDNDIPNSLQELLQEMDIEYQDGLILSRVMTKEGKNTCRINGIKVTASILRDVTAQLVDIYGQHDTATLLLPKKHLPILDAFGKDSLESVYGDYREKYKTYKALQSQLKQYGALKDVNKRMQTLQEKIEEIEHAKFRIGEEEELASKLARIESIGAITEGVNNGCEYIDGEDGACQSLRLAISELKDIVGFDDVIKESHDRLDSAVLEIEDVSNTLSRMLSRFDYDAYEKDKIITRLDYIRDVMMRYGSSEESALARLDKYQKEYEYLADSEFEVIELNKKIAIAIQQLYDSAVALSTTRYATAKEFESAVLKELKDLGMSKTKFEVSFVERPSQENFLKVVNESGIDQAEFLISPNPGQPLKPLAKIISGGEMSRFMLALKKITAEIDGINLMIFDEIDTGISGNIATVVAKALSDISSNKQVLAITHLPQLASYADTHYYIQKSQTDTDTTTAMTRLDNEGVVKELARLIGGDSENSVHAIAHAKEMLKEAQSHKNRD